jgi:hypothetical protein
MVAWLKTIPAWLRWLFVGAGSLLSTFSSRLPESLQDAGLCLGVFVLVVALVSLFFAKSNSLASGAHDGPDWPIRQVYFHIDPSVLDNNRWEAVGADIQNRLATGSIKAWGQLDDGQLRPLTPIPQEFWAKADLMDNFFLEGNRTEELIHAQLYDTTSRTRTSYRNLRFNGAEVLRAWPSKWPPRQR